MTNGEAIEELKARYLTMSQCLDKEELHKANEALDMAIKALEQEPILDKIRAEIEKEADTSNRLQGISEIGLRKALKIIDKYKAGKEGKK